MEAQEYFAEYSGACGLTLLTISREESGPFVRVYGIGEQAPDQVLRPHAWRSSRFIVKGRLTGKQRGAEYCGYYPEFEVLSFKPWGAVKRCTVIPALDPNFGLYTEELPTDRFVPEDYWTGPEPRRIDDESCRSEEKCAGKERLVRDCGRDVKTWCCRLLPPEEGR